MPSQLVTPHGETLIDLMVDPDERNDLKELSRDYPSWSLTDRQICDLELLMNGGFSPLEGFLNRSDYEGVCSEMRLTDGTIFPIPITLDVPEETVKELDGGSPLVLRDSEGVMLAVLDVEDIWEPDLTSEAKNVYGTTDPEHPGVAYLQRYAHRWCVGGKIRGVELPHHYDFTELRLTPLALRKRLAEMGWKRTVAFQTRNPMHRAHQELTLRAAKQLNASLLIHPVVGVTKPGDVDHYTRVRCYQGILSQYPPGTALLSLLPLAMRMGGPREAILHAVIRKNYGCSHLIVGRDHAGPGHNSNGDSFYGPYEAQELFSDHEDELGIRMVPFKMMVYLKEQDAYVPQDELPEGAKARSLSGTELREHLSRGHGVPKWFSFPKVIQELQRTYPPRSKRGITVFFTGLPSSGKSTLANVLQIRLLEMGGRPVTLLDGDIVRKNLSSELGFSKEHRDLNIRRIGFVASEITKNRGIAICAPIAPYEVVRKEVRQTIEATGGGFVLVHVSTPIEVCEQRDRKGLYAKARAGIVKEFTGVSDPYEIPTDAELVIDTASPADQCVEEIMQFLESEHYVRKNTASKPKGSA